MRGVTPRLTGRIRCFLRRIQNNKKPVNYKENKKVRDYVKTFEMTCGL